ncbi:hypothetical protein SpCBS45565_g00114 [Spizellomyces sp. 'palustris']|nr:hypothetical protein SpCBS45565_g00114 [Spizellomyces sp. 'palustris']
MATAQSAVNRLPKTAADALYSMYTNELGDRLKALENTIDPSVPSESPFIIRLDGVSFRMFTKGLRKPFDERLTDALIDTTKDLICRFNAVLGYSQSDEISLVFPPAWVADPAPADNALEIVPARAGTPSAPPLPPAATSPPSKHVTPQKHMYSGRVQKLASVTASYATARLNYYLSAQNWDDLASQHRERMLAHVAYFDGRVVPTPDAKTVMECIFWRSNFDGFRNSISHISHSYFTSRQLHNKGLKEQLEMLSEKGVDPFQEYQAKFLFGAWVKKEQYELHGKINLKTGAPVQGPVLRSRIRTGSFNWADWSEDERIRFTMAKHWAIDPSSPPKHPLAVTNNSESL